MKYTSDISSRTLRNAHDFRLPNYKSDRTRNSIFYEGLKLFNELPPYIKNIDGLQTFKVHCKKFILETYPFS